MRMNAAVLHTGLDFYKIVYWPGSDATNAKLRRLLLETFRHTPDPDIDEYTTILH